MGFPSLVSLVTSPSVAGYPVGVKRGVVMKTLSRPLSAKFSFFESFCRYMFFELTIVRILPVYWLQFSRIETSISYSSCAFLLVSEFVFDLLPLIFYLKVVVALTWDGRGFF